MNDEEMDDQELEATKAEMASMGAIIHAQEAEWRARARADPQRKPVTREELEWNRDQMTIAMMQDDDFVSAHMRSPMSRPMMLDVYARWSRGELAFTPSPTFHEVVGEHVAALQAETADKRKKANGPEIIEYMRYCLDAGESLNDALDHTAKAVGDDSDVVTRYWNRSGESKFYKKRRRQVSK